MSAFTRFAVSALCLSVAVLAAQPSFADARKGGHFVGGHGPHHLGGHEVGGHVVRHPLRNLLRRL